MWSMNYGPTNQPNDQRTDRWCHSEVAILKSRKYEQVTVERNAINQLISTTLFSFKAVAATWNFLIAGWTKQQNWYFDKHKWKKFYYRKYLTYTTNKYNIHPLKTLENMKKHIFMSFGNNFFATIGTSS